MVLAWSLSAGGRDEPGDEGEIRLAVRLLPGVRFPSPGTGEGLAVLCLYESERQRVAVY